MYHLHEFPVHVVREVVNSSISKGSREEVVSSALTSRYRHKIVQGEAKNSPFSADTRETSVGDSNLKCGWCVKIIK